MDNEMIQAMRQLLLEERVNTQKMLKSELTAELAPIKEDISSLKSDVAVLKSDVSVLKSDVSVLQSDVAGVKSDLDELKDRTLRIELTLENEVANKIGSLYDGHLLNTQKLEQLQESIDEMAPTVLALDVLHKMQTYYGSAKN